MTWTREGLSVEEIGEAVKKVDAIDQGTNALELFESLVHARADLVRAEAVVDNGGTFEEQLTEAERLAKSAKDNLHIFDVELERSWRGGWLVASDAAVLAALINSKHADSLIDAWLHYAKSQRDKFDE